MKTRSKLFTLALMIGLTSCSSMSNDELRDSLQRRNERYLERQERRQMREQARQERTDAWFDRVMH